VYGISAKLYSYSHPPKRDAVFAYYTGVLNPYPQVIV
jgi:hypothetical protein